MCAADETSSLGFLNVILKVALHYIRINKNFLPQGENQMLGDDYVSYSHMRCPGCLLVHLPFPRVAP